MTHLGYFRMDAQILRGGAPFLEPPGTQDEKRSSRDAPRDGFSNLGTTPRRPQKSRACSALNRESRATARKHELPSGAVRTLPRMQMHVGAYARMDECTGIMPLHVPNVAPNLYIIHVRLPCGLQEFRGHADDRGCQRNNCSSKQASESRKQISYLS